MMGAALRGVLAVHEREIALAVARSVGNGDLDILAREVDGLVERLLGHVLVQQVEQTVFRDVGLAVQPEGEAEVQIGVVLHHLLHVLHVVGVGAEHLLVHAERDEGAVLLLHAALPAVALLDPFGEGHRMGLAVAHRTGGEFAREHVHGLDAHAVQTHGLLEGLAAVLAAGVHLADGRRERLQGDAASVVAHRDPIVLDGDLHLTSGAHDELVHRVVHHLLDKHVDTVVGLRAVAQLADIHARTQPDMLARREGDDGVVAVIVVRIIQ